MRSLSKLVVLALSSELFAMVWFMSATLEILGLFLSTVMQKLARLLLTTSLAILNKQKEFEMQVETSTGLSIRTAICLTGVCSAPKECGLEDYRYLELWVMFKPKTSSLEEYRE